MSNIQRSAAVALLVAAAVPASAIANTKPENFPMTRVQLVADAPRLQLTGKTAEERATLLEIIIGQQIGDNYQIYLHSMDLSKSDFVKIAAAPGAEAAIGKYFDALVPWGKEVQNEILNGGNNNSQATIQKIIADTRTLNSLGNKVLDKINLDEIGKMNIDINPNDNGHAYINVLQAIGLISNSGFLPFLDPTQTKESLSFKQTDMFAQYCQQVGIPQENYVNASNDPGFQKLFVEAFANLVDTKSYLAKVFTQGLLSLKADDVNVQLSNNLQASLNNGNAAQAYAIQKGLAPNPEPVQKQSYSLGPVSFQHKYAAGLNI